MSATTTVTIHSSQYPAKIAEDLARSMISRKVNHKFHYDTPKQTLKWLELHEAYSPARTDPDCLATYERAFKAAISSIIAPEVCLIGLGCGGGQKDLELLQLLTQAGVRIHYIPVDVSVSMVLVAAERVASAVPGIKCSPMVCDLETGDDVPQALAALQPPAMQRIVTFFGMMPNFEPHTIMPRLQALLNPEDWLLFSANLAPGGDYAAGVAQVLPLYDNRLTREWLMIFLKDRGLNEDHGILQFRVEEDVDTFKLKRICAKFTFNQPVRLTIPGHSVSFNTGEDIRLFFSYRHTPGRIVTLFQSFGFALKNQWLTSSGEEGVFLAQRLARVPSI